MVRYEIYNATYQWKDCADTRPWLIIDVLPNGMFGCFPIASQGYRDGTFHLDPNHPDFAATGLTRACHVH